eukprot:467386-Prymnesium_polylepis.1
MATPPRTVSRSSAAHPCGRVGPSTAGPARAGRARGRPAQCHGRREEKPPLSLEVGVARGGVDDGRCPAVRELLAPRVGARQRARLPRPQLVVEGVELPQEHARALERI